MPQKIDGIKIAEKIKDEIVKEIYNNGQRPNLAIILVGEREDSKLYVNLKQKQAKKVGIDTHLYKLPQNSSEEELLETINFLNKDGLIDGILVQLPLPEGFDTDKVIQSIDPKKDVDCFHSESVKNINQPNKNLSPVFSSILEIFKDTNYNIENKKIAVIYNSEIFGNSLKSLLENKGAIVSLIKSKDKDSEKIKACDVVISAVGKPNYIKAKDVKKDSFLIDIGITKKNKKVKGDIGDKAIEKSSYFTPVPGGIGPLTIAILFRNTWELFKKKNNK